VPANILLVDRAHRVPCPSHLPDTTPRDVLIRVHYYYVKEHILRASRNKAKPPEDYPTVHLFTDISAVTLRRRKEFAPVTMRYVTGRMRYVTGGVSPTKLLAMREGSLKPIMSPEDGVRKLKAWGITPHGDTDADSSPARRLRLKCSTAPTSR
ncbi:Hypothetical predicted protein, partial [Pelobates cultripes]